MSTTADGIEGTAAAPLIRAKKYDPILESIRSSYGCIQSPKACNDLQVELGMITLGDDETVNQFIHRIRNLVANYIEWLSVSMTPDSSKWHMISISKSSRWIKPSSVWLIKWLSAKLHFPSEIKLSTRFLPLQPPTEIRETDTFAAIIVSEVSSQLMTRRIVICRSKVSQS